MGWADKEAKKQRSKATNKARYPFPHDYVVSFGDEGDERHVRVIKKLCDEPPPAAVLFFPGIHGCVPTARTAGGASA